MIIHEIPITYRTPAATRDIIETLRYLFAAHLLQLLCTTGISGIIDGPHS